MFRTLTSFISHPFDLESYSHCHLSNTDVLTQQNWQMTAPMWTAVVIDPLRSIALQQPELGAYRVYPQRYTPPASG
jgi:COP9 signalosome complex subunit 5